MPPHEPVPPPSAGAAPSARPPHRARRAVVPLTAAAVLLGGPALWAGLRPAALPAAASSGVAPSTALPGALVPAGAQGVLAACRTILPAMRDVQTTTSPQDGPDDVTAQLAALQGTLRAAGAAAGAPAFAGHVQQLADDFGRLTTALGTGGDTAAVEQELQQDGTVVGTDCGLAGWQP